MPHPFPTRRSSDLGGAIGVACDGYTPASVKGERLADGFEGGHVPELGARCAGVTSAPVVAGTRAHGDEGVAAAERSEEHTSELQSLMRISYAVFFLKKKKKPYPHTQ